MAPFVPGKGPAATPLDVPRSRQERVRRIAFIVIAVLCALVALAVAAGAWVGVRAALAAAALDRAQASVAALRDGPVAPSELPERLDAVVADARAARSLTGDPVWRVAELLPALGPNLSAARELASAVGRVGDEILAPASSALAEVQSIQRRDGQGLDLSPVVSAAEELAGVSDSLSSIRAEVAAVHTDGVVGPLVDARGTLLAAFDEIAPALDQVAAAASVVPSMLGSDEPRNYLLMFANNAEARPLQGIPASFALLTIDGDGIELAAQASSRDFPRGGEPPLALPGGVLEAYYSAFPRFVMDLPTRPDFPTVGELARAYWQQEFGTAVDGVAVIDPVVLGYLLEGAAPIALPEGQVLDAAGAAPLLLSEVYSLYPAKHDTDPEEAAQNAFLEATAARVFDAVLAGETDPAALASGLARGVQEGRVMFWSAHRDEQDAIARTPIAGTLPAGNEEETVLGVYLMNMSSNKVDYWMRLDVDASASCSPDGDVYTVTYTMDSTLTQEQADALPFYQTGGWWGTEHYRTDSYVLGPVGARYLDATVDQPALKTDVISVAEDLGRPVVRLASDYRPGGEVRVTVRFALDADGGPLAVRTTPLVHPVDVSVEDACG